MDKSIMPECYADTLLIETLVPPKSGYNHKHSCFKVESAMKSVDKFALGIIDNDKKQIKYLEKFEIIDELTGSLILWKHNNLSQFIIQICPALEKWVLNVCETENIDVTEIGLMHDLEEMKRYTKSVSSIEDKKLKWLFKAISNKEENISVRKLRGWVKLLKEKNYQVEINELKNV